MTNSYSKPLEKETCEIETCSICLEDIKHSEKVLKCGHSFHTKCIHSWLKTKYDCPNCRNTEMNEIDTFTKCCKEVFRKTIPTVFNPTEENLVKFKVILRKSNLFANSVLNENMDALPFGKVAEIITNVVKKPLIDMITKIITKIGNDCKNPLKNNKVKILIKYLKELQPDHGKVILHLNNKQYTF